jgi:glycosyl transferase family 87
VNERTHAADGSQARALLAFGAFATLVLGACFALYHLFDFHVFWQASRHVLDGRSPYPHLASIADDKRTYYVYPPLLALLTTPLAMLPFPVAGALFSLLLIACVPLTLRLLGVTDRACLVVCFVWMTTLQAIAIGTVGPLLALGVAAAWRYRDRRVVSALAVAAVICTKLFLWPLVVWLVATRRTATALGAVVSGAALALAAWAAIGFAGFSSYHDLLQRLTAVERWRAFSLGALAHGLGLPSSVGLVAVLIVGGGSLAAVFALARRPDGDRRGLSAAIGAALALSPIVWLHYFFLLIVPIGLARRTLSRLWLAPMLLWWPAPHSGGSPLLIAWILAAAGGILFAATRPAGASTTWDLITSTRDYAAHP